MTLISVNGLNVANVHIKVYGKAPVGYGAPVYSINQEVIDLLVEHGFRYHSSMMAFSHRIKTAKGRLWKYLSLGCG